MRYERADVACSGFLRKLGKMRKKWRRRFCVLAKNGVLSWFISRGDFERNQVGCSTAMTAWKGGGDVTFTST